MLWLATLALLAVAALIDWSRHEIPDLVPVSLLLGALVAFAVGVTPPRVALGGFALGASVGMLGFSLGALGGGDAKLLAGTGACLGAADLAWTLAFAAIASGALGAVALLRRRREFAFAPALLAGALAAFAARAIEGSPA